MSLEQEIRRMWKCFSGKGVRLLSLRCVLLGSFFFALCLPGCGGSTTNNNNTANCGGVCTAAQECVQNQFCLPKCAAGQSRCGVACVDLKTSKTHCGKCDAACAAGESCAEGACKAVPSCAAGETDCAGSCVDLKADKANCGACATACKAEETCNNGVCELLNKCQASQTDCGGSCVDVQTNAEHCGKCDNKCGAEQACESGACACTGGRTKCGGTCVDTDNSDAHCGGCDKACPTPQYCDLGKCLCPSGQEICGGGCVDVQTSAEHCGKCDNKCPAGTSCDAGTCQCPNKGTLCGGACVDTQTDKAHCGACDKACATGEKCSVGLCQKDCATGETDCNGSCVDVQTSAEHCGACDNKCTGGKRCDVGSCKCPTGKTDCGGVCVELQTDTAHCGQCSKACATGESCVNGACKSPCPSGQTDCNGSCVDLQTSATDCGVCGTACTGGKSCEAGSCKCPAGQSDCSGTCIATDSDDANCGACGSKCASGKVCRAGACQGVWASAVASPQGAGRYTLGGLASGAKGNTYLSASSFNSTTNTKARYLYHFDSTGTPKDLSTPGIPARGYGFHASKNADQAVSATGWVKVQDWKVSGVVGLLPGLGFDASSGDYTAPVDGYYHFKAQIRLDNIESGPAGRYVRVLLAIDGNTDVNNGRHTIHGEPTSPYFIFNVAATVKLTKGQKVSVHIYSHTDNSYSIFRGQSGFSGVFLGHTLTSGFHAAKAADQAVTAVGWKKVNGWKTSAGTGLFNQGAFDTASGDFTTPVDGYYHFSAQIRLDNVNGGDANHHIRVGFFVNDRISDLFKNGTTAILGQPKAPYHTLTLSSTLFLTKGQKVSVHVYSHNDSAYTIQRESGVSGHLVARSMPSGFHAAKSQIQQVTTSAWTKVSGWSASSTTVPGLFNAGGFDPSAGEYTVSASGLYLLNAQVRLQAASAGNAGRYCHVAFAINDVKEWTQGDWGLIGNPTAAWFTMTTESALYLTKGQKVSVHVLCSQDSQYTVGLETGFSIHMVGSKDNYASASSLALDANDNLYLSGAFGGYGKIGDHLLRGGQALVEGRDAFVAKRSSGGDWEWAKSTSPMVDASSLSLGANDALFVCGPYIATVWKYSSTRQITDGPGVIVKLDSKGDLQWALGIKSSTGPRGALPPAPQCAPASGGSLFAFGNFYGQGKLGGSTFSSPGGSYHYIARVSNLGLFLWAKDVKAEIPSWGVATDKNDNVYAGGSFKTSFKFESTVNYSARATDALEAFVMKLDSNGKLLWSVKADTTQGNTYLERIAVGPKGTIYVSGSFDGTVAFGNNNKLTTKGKSDIFLAALSSDGKWLWAKQVGGPEDENSSVLAVDGSGNVFLGGVFSSATLQLGTKQLTKQGSSANAFVAKNLP